MIAVEQAELVARRRWAEHQLSEWLGVPSAYAAPITYPTRAAAKIQLSKSRPRSRKRRWLMGLPGSLGGGWPRLVRTAADGPNEETVGRATRCAGRALIETPLEPFIEIDERSPLGVCIRGKGWGKFWCHGASSSVVGDGCERVDVLLDRIDRVDVALSGAVEVIRWW